MKPDNDNHTLQGREVRGKASGIRAVNTNPATLMALGKWL